MSRPLWFRFAVAMCSLSLGFLAACGDDGPGTPTCDPSCALPPAPICNGDVLTSFLPNGTCTADGCQFLQGGSQTCELGCFAEENRCYTEEDVCGVCDAPPAAYCEDNTAISFSAAGCDPDSEECIYDPRQQDCGALDLICIEGACVPADLCEGVVCDSPPATSCADTGSVVSYSPEGTCDAATGQCQYDNEVTACEDDAACIDGVCTTCDDLGIVCEQAPPPECRGLTAVTFAPEGVCDPVAGECSFVSESSENCGIEPGGYCIGGECRQAPECDTFEDCAYSTAPVCDGDTLIEFNSEGSCINNYCVFNPIETDCTTVGDGFGCYSGACGLSDECEGVFCDIPPEPYCVGNVAVDFDSESGLCIGGDCRFEAVRTDCVAASTPDEPLSCVAGQCIGRAELCEGVVCDSPQPDRCFGDFLIEFAEAGTCNASGTCTYEDTRTDCRESNQRCLDDGGGPACVDVCADVDCSSEVLPEPTCDGNTAVEYVPDSAACVLGVCEFTEVRTSCTETDQLCSAGSCVDDEGLCTGVICDRPPAGTCDGEVASGYELIGSCDPASGGCNYAEVERDCGAEGFLCISGYCNDPCEGISCDSPPSSSCADGDTIRTFVTGADACNLGVCEYTPIEQDCDIPPMPSCSGDILVTYTSDGTCVSDRCTYPREFTDCIAEGARCEDDPETGGACVAFDVCDEVTCDSPPASFCDGEIAFVYPETGECLSGGVCDYTSAVVTEDCSAVIGGTCVDGACVDPCTDVTCDSPPGGTCEGNLAFSYEPSGTCSAGVCDYEEVVLDCAAVPGGSCTDGACSDPCLGITCDAPPAAVCAGDTLETYEASGICNAEGACIYTRVNVACDEILGGSCFDGACVTECDDGCDAPPAPFCEGELAYTYEDGGVCEEGLCDYPVVVEDCAAVAGGTCVDGACVDPCGDLACDSPPDSECVGELFIEYETPGECFAGDCSYVPAVTDCAAVLGGSCTPSGCVDPCAGVTCDSPPADSCDANTLVTYEPSGVCVDGTCEYEEVNVSCDVTLGGICVAGECTSACETEGCDPAPAPSCEGDLLFVYADGLCDAETDLCDYPLAVTDCSAVAGGFCLDGACVDPCEGVACEAPPAASCLGDVAIAYTSPGECYAGDCEYSPVYDVCNSVIGGFCDSGACANVCDGVACDAPPAPVCDGDLLISFEEAGICDVDTDSMATSCVYIEASPINCPAEVGGDCFEGACRTECEVGCGDPPDSFCDGDTFVEYTTPDCPEGVCEWAFDETECTTLGAEFICDDALGCIDPCAGVTCDSPPADTCTDETFTTYEDGFCVDGECVYTPLVLGCPGEAGDVCEGSACVIVDPCEGVVCDDTRDSVCLTGNILQTYEASICVSGICEFPFGEQIDCGAIGQSCVEELGACVEGDPCDILDCSRIPENRCEGSLLYEYSGPAECMIDEDFGAMCDVSGVETVTDCSLTDSICSEGACVPVATPTVGDIVVTEMMITPNGDDAEQEYIELHNTSGNPVLLTGLVVRDPTTPANSFTLGSGNVIEPFGYFVIGADASAGPTDADGEPIFDADWAGSSFSLGDTSGGALLIFGSELDRVEYDGSWEYRTGFALEFSGVPDTDDNSLASNWCASPRSYSPTNRGTPGQGGGSCVVDASDVTGTSPIVVSEIMVDTTGADNNWFALYNAGIDPLFLDGVSVSNEAGQTIDLPNNVFIDVGGEVVLAESNDAVDVTVVAVFPGSFVMQILGDTLTVTGAGDPFAVSYDTSWPYALNVAMSLDPSGAGYADRVEYWCNSPDTYDGGARNGSPGVINSGCDGIFGNCSSNDDCGAMTWCEGELLVTASAASTCDTESGTCNYDALELIDCMESDQICRAGACVDP